MPSTTPVRSQEELLHRANIYRDVAHALCTFDHDRPLGGRWEIGGKIGRRSVVFQDDLVGAKILLASLLAFDHGKGNFKLPVTAHDLIWLVGFRIRVLNSGLFPATMTGSPTGLVDMVLPDAIDWLTYRWHAIEALAVIGAKHKVLIPRDFKDTLARLETESFD